MKKQDTLSTFEFHELIPDEAAAVKWFEATRWNKGRYCPHCESLNTSECKKPQPYRCKDCRKHFSAKTATVMQSSKLPVRKWLYAMYLMSVSKKGLSSIQLGRELGIAQEAAWRLGHKIREAWNQDALFLDGEIEVDETCIGGKEKNRPASKRLRLVRGGVGKQPVMGMRTREGKVRAFPIEKTDAQTLQGHIRRNIAPDAMIYTDGHKGYLGMRDFRHEAVAHSAGEYVRGQTHTNGIESFWSLLKRGYVGSFHYMSVKHLSRYVDKFCFRNNNKDITAVDFMTQTAVHMTGRRLSHNQLVSGE